MAFSAEIRENFKIVQYFPTTQERVQRLFVCRLQNVKSDLKAYLGPLQCGGEPQMNFSEPILPSKIWHFQPNYVKISNFTIFPHHLGAGSEIVCLYITTRKK